MQFNQILLPLLIIVLIAFSETGAGAGPGIASRSIQNGTVVAGNRTDTPQQSNSTDGGLGSDPIRTDHGQAHDLDFFEPTAKNIRDSRFGAAYVLWFIGVDKNSTAWRERLSEPDFFAKTVLEWPDDVNCGVAYNGCDMRPSCNDISERIENRTRARQICYIFDSFHHVSLITAQIHAQSIPAQVDVIARAKDLAGTFFWKFDPAIQKKCEMIATFVKSLIQAVMFAALAAAPLAAPAQVGALATEGEFAAAEAGGLSEATNLVEIGDGAGLPIEEVSTGTGEIGETTVTEVENVGEATEAGTGESTEAGAGETLDGVSEGGPQSGAEGNGPGGSGPSGQPGKNPQPPKKRAPGAKLPWLTRQLYGKAGKPKVIGWHRIAEGKTSVVVNALLAFPVSLGGPGLTEAICNDFPNAKKEDEEEWYKMLSNKMAAAGEEYRSTIDGLLKEMNMGSGFGDDGAFVEPYHSIMSETIFRGDYVRLTQYERTYFIEETSKLEEAMKQYFLNAAISLSLKSSMCYIHCTRDDAAAKSKLSFSPEPGVTCQPQCWRNWKDDKQMKMFGVDELMKPDNGWGTDASTFLTQSYKHWQWSRYGPDIMFPTVDQLFYGETSDSTSGASVPVCFSPQPIKDVAKHPKGTDAALPCICGDDIGNETASFFTEANFRSWVGAKSGEGVVIACQDSFNREHVRPVQAYLALCHLGWHFPVVGDNDDRNATNAGFNYFSAGRDALCDDFEREAQDVIDRGGDDTQVNCHLCWLSKIGKKVKETQKVLVFLEHYPHADTDERNFNFACEELMSKKKVCKLVT